MKKGRIRVNIYKFKQNVFEDLINTISDKVSNLLGRVAGHMTVGGFMYIIKLLHVPICKIARFQS